MSVIPVSANGARVIGGLPGGARVCRISAAGLVTRRQRIQSERPKLKSP